MVKALNVSATQVRAIGIYTGHNHQESYLRFPLVNTIYICGFRKELHF